MKNMCEEVHFSKFAGLQAYSCQLYCQMNSFTGIFRQHLKSSHASPCIDLSPTPHPSTCCQHLWETLLFTVLSRNSTNETHYINYSSLYFFLCSLQFFPTQIQLHNPKKPNQIKVTVN